METFQTVMNVVFTLSSACMCFMWSTKNALNIAVKLFWFVCSLSVAALTYHVLVP